MGKSALLWTFKLLMRAGETRNSLNTMRISISYYLIFGGARITYLTILSMDLIAFYMSCLAMPMLVIIHVFAIIHMTS